MGAFSVNTNESAFIALQSLTQTIKRLEKTQLNITTGLRLNRPKDDAATFSIAQNQRGNIAGFTAVKIAPSSGEAAVDVAITAGK
jgi:flagellin